MSEFNIPPAVPVPWATNRAAAARAVVIPVVGTGVVCLCMKILLMTQTLRTPEHIMV
jgi:hypothetical protein